MILITGTYPPERCGVGDYSQHLLNAAVGKSWTLFYRQEWKWRNLRAYLADLRNMEDKTINLQYPTMGYGTSLVPHVLMMCAVLLLGKRLYITVHEYSQLGWKGKMALNLLFLFAKDVVFTTSFELECARKHNPWMRKGQVVKIRSNIPAAPGKPMGERHWDVGYFGYIRPLKGLEEFVDVAGQLQQAGKRVYVMGQVQPEFESFHRPLLQLLKQKGITYFGNCTQEEVAQQLSDTKIMYLPYPDGLSERRGSFLAAVVNGAAVISREGAFTSRQQREKFSLVNPDQACAQISGWLDDKEWLDEQQRRSLSYAAESVPTSWEQIVDEYMHIMR